MICVRVLVVSVFLYLVIECKLMWLGILPVMIFFIKQNLIMLRFMLKLV